MNSKSKLSENRKFYVSGFPNKRGKFKITNISHSFQDDGDGGKYELYDIEMGQNGTTYVPGKSKLKFRDNQGKPMSASQIHAVMKAEQLNEGLQQGDLSDMISNVISIDEYKSKILDDDQSIVVVFQADSKEAAFDLGSFIEKSPYDFMDTEVSAAPDVDGKYSLFCEIERNDMFIEHLMRIMVHIKKLTDQKEWHFEAFKMAGKRPLTVKELKSAIRLEKIDQLPRAEALPEEPVELTEMEKSDDYVIRWVEDEY